MSKMIDKDKLARLAQALDDRADAKVSKETERAIQVEAGLQILSDETRAMLGGKSLKYLTQAEYDNLSDAEKNDPNVIYYITDLEDAAHSHYNKELLDLIDDNFMNTIGKGSAISTVIPTAEGWYRIASTTRGPIKGSHIALINIKTTNSEASKNDNMILIANASHGNISVQQLAMATSGSRRISQVRVVCKATATETEAYLEVYANLITVTTQNSKVDIQILGDSSWQLMDATLIDTEYDNTYNIAEINTVPGKIVGEFEGAINEAAMLSNSRNITIGNCIRQFDGTADINYSLNEMGVAPKTSDDLTTENKNLIEAINELDAEIDDARSALSGYKIWVGTTEELFAIPERDPMTLYFEISDEVDYTEINDPNVIDEHLMTLESMGISQIPAYDGDMGIQENPGDVILTSPSGFKFKLLVDDFGMLYTERVDEY